MWVILGLSILIVFGSVFCEDHVSNISTHYLVEGRTFENHDSIGGNEKHMQLIAHNEEFVSDQPFVTEAFEYSTNENSTEVEESDSDEYGRNHHYSMVDTIVQGESLLEMSDSSETTIGGGNLKKLASVNINELTNSDPISSTGSTSVYSNLLNKPLMGNNPSSHIKDFTERIESVVNLSEKVVTDKSIIETFEEQSLQNDNMQPEINDSPSREFYIFPKHSDSKQGLENNADAKRGDNSTFKAKSEDLFRTFSSVKAYSNGEIMESTFATTYIAPTTMSARNIEESQIQSTKETFLKNPKDNPTFREQHLNKSLQPKFETASILNETTLEIIPNPEKLFAHNLERDDPIESFIDIYKDTQLSSQTVILTEPLLEDEENFKQDKDTTNSILKDYSSSKEGNFGRSTLFENCSDCDVGILPITPLGQRSTPTAEEESLPSSKIIFADLPEGREIQINSLGLSDGIFLFSYISEFLSWIQPNDFPVELLKDALKNEMSWISLITQSLQVEVGFVACLVAGVLLALAVPIVVLSHACYRMGGRTDDSGEDNGGWAGNCRRRTLVFILQLLLVLLCAGMVGMFVTNEQLSSAVVQSSEVVQTALSDVSAFIHNSHLQLHFLLTQSLDQTLQAVFADLDNIDTLLGRPIQKELVRETGLDVALESLSDMTKEVKSVTLQVERFLEEVRSTQDLLTSSRDKLSDLRQQVELFRRACGPRDRTMCDTIDASGLEVTFRLDKIKTDERLIRMRRMGGVGLEIAVSEAKSHFQTVPAKVEADTRNAKEDVRRLLTRQRAAIDEHTLALEKLARDLTSKVGEARYQAGYWTQDLDQLEYWRWIICMGGGVAVLMIWSMLLCSMCCGCCGSEKAAGPTILVTIVLLCLFSTALWTLVMVGLLVGGHSEVFLCRPLYEEPEFNVLSRLVDKPGVFYEQPSGGFIGNVIYGNNSIDVPIKNILRECRDSRPVYPTLGLHRVMDVEYTVSQARWGEIKTHLRGIRANLSHLEVLSPVLTDQLGDLLTTLSINFTEHRIQMSKPVTGKDLDSFAKQLDNIGNQLRDLATASRIETLSSRTRRLIDSHIRPLEGRKDALVYQLTALEVQTQPLQRQINQSLSHLKTIQFFINSQGEAIAQRKSRDYVDRLLRYVDQLHDHVIRSAREAVAPCRPLWDIFNNSRLFLCRHTVDPLNGYWFATMWCLLVLLVATPVCLKLVDYYRVQGARSSGSPSENLMSTEQGGGWSTPGYDIKCRKEHQ